MRFHIALCRSSSRYLLGGFLGCCSSVAVWGQIPVVQSPPVPIVQPAPIVSVSTAGAVEPASGNGSPVIAPVQYQSSIPVIRPASRSPEQDPALAPPIQQLAPVVRGNQANGPSIPVVIPARPGNAAPKVSPPPAPVVGTGTLPVLSREWNPIAPTPAGERRSENSESQSPPAPTVSALQTTDANQSNGPAAAPGNVRLPVVRPVTPGDFASAVPSRPAGFPNLSGTTPSDSYLIEEQGPALAPSRAVVSEGYISGASDDYSLASSTPIANGCGCDSGDCGGSICGTGECVTGDCGIGMGYLNGSGPVRRIASRIRGRLDGFGNAGTRYGMCGFCPDASRYLVADFLYWTRESSAMIGTNFGGVGDYDYEPGWRITAGRRHDVVSANEISYLGMLPLESNTVQNSLAGDIDAQFLPGGGFGAAQLDAFFDAEQTNQSLITQLHSLQFNRVRHSWDVARSHYGFRYIYLEDDYRYTSQSGADTGAFTVGAVNHLFGPEVGLDLLYDVGRRVSWSGFGKLGGYAAINTVDTTLVHNGTRFLANRDGGGNFAASLDLGLNAHLHVTQNSRLRAGYNAMWLWGVASATENYPAVLTPTTGLNVDDSDSVFFHGLNFGIEIFR